MIKHLDLEVEVQTELMNIGLIIASVPIPQGDWSPLVWPKLMAELSEHLDLVSRALEEGSSALGEDISMSRSPDIINICATEALVSRSFRISPPQMAKTLILKSFRPDELE